MKDSISIKLFLTVSLLLFLVILTVLLLNTTTLEIFYRSQKASTLKEIYSLSKNHFIVSISDPLLDAFELENNIINPDFNNELSRIDSIKNVELVILDYRDVVVFQSSSNFIKNGLFFKRDFFYPDMNLNEFKSGQVEKYLTKNNDYTISIVSDNKMNTDYMMLYGKLNDNYKIFIRTPLEAIKESVKISNTFLIIIGFICIVASSILTFILAKEFTKPIEELDDIAKHMANLDFSKKYKVTTKDEIGTLGKSINDLSTSLEKTIEELRQANLDLERDVEEKSKLNEMRNQFISDVSHELKTPIALIQGYAEGLIDGIATDEESKKYYLEVIVDEANKMSNLTKDLLDLSRLEYDKTDLNIDEFDITDLIRNTLKNNKLLFDEKQINCTFDETREIIVKGDSSRIEQVITNYISNAIKNVNEEKIIRCSVNNADDDHIKVSIFNSGKHISEDDITRLWNRFYRVDSSRNRETGGTGIGLSLVKAIMTKHNNKYGVENVDGGVEFWFELNKK